MKKRLKKKVIKQLAAKSKRMESTGEKIKPTELESRVAESIFKSEFDKFQTKEYLEQTIYSEGYLTRMQRKVKEIDNMFKSKNLLELAKKM
ncbi:hypothetical protein SAMN05421839_10626 [Halolactibacillus halophilus]|uniref:Uncharacterized protein n=1 Tax=Halolactibacillus halophilus TaxID=306540 RepID=A0A1I5MN51_9BACI|nr:hypothetical protein [Halolactibacillus halophilus]GEM02518.1 hypothetical protein HHA03_20500 [Halolactibacillus halophilus]SFP10953.1 hypothetical protein SAMN05421839_10626 [Halolactibacillus halophilus]